MSSTRYAARVRPLRRQRLNHWLAASSVAAVWVLAGCGGPPPGTSDSGTPNGAGEGTETFVTAPDTPVAVVPDGQLVKSGELTVCTYAPAPPNEFYAENGELVGSDIDTGNAIGTLLKLKTTWVQTGFDTIIASLNTGKCDLIIAGFFITPERQAQVDMIPYYSVREALLIQKDNPHQISDDWQSLCGKPLVVQSGTAQAETAIDYNGQCQNAGLAPIAITTITDLNGAVQTVASGQAAAFFFDSNVVEYYAHQRPNDFASAGPGVLPVNAGIAVGKDHPELRSAVVAALTKLQDDGTYQKILDKWGFGGTDVPRPN